MLIYRHIAQFFMALNIEFFSSGELPSIYQSYNYIINMMVNSIENFTGWKKTKSLTWKLQTQGNCYFPVQTSIFFSTFKKL